MQSKALVLAAGLLAVAVTATAAEAQTRRFHGTVNMGLPFWCMSVGGYNITGTTPAPELGTCIRGSGKLVHDDMSICQGRVLVDVKWRRARGCR